MCVKQLNKEKRILNETNAEFKCINKKNKYQV